jgi:integrase/recombinase XerD
MVKVWRSFVRGPLEPQHRRVRRAYAAAGYTRTSAGQQVCFFAHLDRWMSVEGIGLDGLGGADRAVSGSAPRRWVCRVLIDTGAAPLLDYLAPLGVLPAEEEAPPSPVEELPDRYHGYLIGERGLTDGTARGYVDFVRPFVTTRVRSDLFRNPVPVDRTITVR